MIQRRHRDEHAVEGEPPERLDQDLGIGVAADADVTHQPLVPRLERGLRQAPPCPVSTSQQA